jgi:hypothetical protein
MRSKSRLPGEGPPLSLYLALIVVTVCAFLVGYFLGG